MITSEQDLHVWATPGTVDMAPLFTISVDGSLLCKDLPLDQATEMVREHLMEMVTEPGL